MNRLHRLHCLQISHTIHCHIHFSIEVHGHAEMHMLRTFYLWLRMICSRAI